MPYTDWRKKMATYEDIQKVNSEIKLSDIGRGDGYAEVPEKVRAFRKLFPMGSITSEILSLQDGVVVIKATASVDGIILGEGIAYEKEGSSFINRTSYIENAQTSAVGRAISFIGLIGGKSIASYEEVANAKKQQMIMDEEEKRAKLKGLLEETNSDVTKFLEWCSEKCEREIASVDVMRDKELDLAIKQVERKKGKK